MHVCIRCTIPCYQACNVVARMPDCTCRALPYWAVESQADEDSNGLDERDWRSVYTPCARKKKVWYTDRGRLVPNDGLTHAYGKPPVHASKPSDKKRQPGSRMQTRKNCASSLFEYICLTDLYGLLVDCYVRAGREALFQYCVNKIPPKYCCHKLTARIIITLKPTIDCADSHA